jgi:hypothetical protein
VKRNFKAGQNPQRIVAPVEEQEEKEGEEEEEEEEKKGEIEERSVKIEDCGTKP